MAVSDIAGREKIPRKFLEAILVELRNAGLVESQIGKRGGYRLAKPPDNITIGSIVRIIDGPLAPSACTDEGAFRTCAECISYEHCQTRLILKQVRDAMAAVLDHITLAEACRRSAESEINYDI
jgi:Rrf2 family protein